VSHRKYVTPNCCKAAKKYVGAYLSFRTWNDTGRTIHPAPVWACTSPGAYAELDIAAPIAVSHCPFCGKPLPEIEQNPSPPKRVQVVTDGGYYCDTCKKRLNECRCYPPEFAWRPA
jgi:hypothetical protein